jgi:hypothetical protein
MRVCILTTLALTAFPVRANIANMNVAKYQSETVASFLKRRKIATLDEIGVALGDAASRTVFRKLSEIEYLSSYSHRGKFYTLKSIAQFSSQGLWSLRSVRFSRFGNLLRTSEALVQRSERGYDASELRSILHVEPKHALTHLARENRVHREPIGGCYVYLSADDAVAEQQRESRETHANATDAATLLVANPDLAVDEAKATLLLFFSILNEKQRRLYAGLEALKLGHGGDAHIAKIFGIDPHTVARGRRELTEGQLDGQRVRAQGGGRLAQEKKRPT